MLIVLAPACGCCTATWVAQRMRRATAGWMQGWGDVKLGPDPFLSYPGVLHSAGGASQGAAVAEDAAVDTEKDPYPNPVWPCATQVDPLSN